MISFYCHSGLSLNNPTFPTLSVDVSCMSVKYGLLHPTLFISRIIWKQDLLRLLWVGFLWLINRDYKHMQRVGQLLLSLNEHHDDYTAVFNSSRNSLWTRQTMSRLVVFDTLEIQISRKSEFAQQVNLGTSNILTPWFPWPSTLTNHIGVSDIGGPKALLFYRRVLSIG